MVATQRRGIYLCPLPSQIFRVAPLAWLGEQALSKGVDPSECEFFGILKRNRKFLVEYVVFGLFRGKEVVASAKDWPENVLTLLPSELQIVELARQEYHRFAKPQRWVTEQTAVKLVDHGMAAWGEDGLLHFGDISLGTYDRIQHDRLYSAANQWTAWKPIEYPKAP